jgi:hypothetical protein
LPFCLRRASGSSPAPAPEPRFHETQAASHGLAPSFRVPRAPSGRPAHRLPRGQTVQPGRLPPLRFSAPSASPRTRQQLRWPGLPRPTACALRFSRPLGAFIRREPAGLVSCRIRSWGCALQSFPPPAQPYAVSGAVPLLPLSTPFGTEPSARPRPPKRLLPCRTGHPGLRPPKRPRTSADLRAAETTLRSWALEPPKRPSNLPALEPPKRPSNLLLSSRRNDSRTVGLSSRRNDSRTVWPSSRQNDSRTVGLSNRRSDLRTRSDQPRRGLPPKWPAQDTVRSTSPDIPKHLGLPPNDDPALRERPRLQGFAPRESPPLVNRLFRPAPGA